MGKKDGELWDDSALLDAFEDAVSSYKFQMMHGMKESDGVKDESLDGDVAEEGIADEEDVKSHVDEVSLPTKDEVAIEEVSKGAVELGIESDLNMQPVADYNALVNQYYELQEKLQQTWEQLQLFGYSSDQCHQYTPEVNLSEDADNSIKASIVSSDANHSDFTASHVNLTNDAVVREPEPCQQNNDQCYSLAGVKVTTSMSQGQATTDFGPQPTAFCCSYPCTDKCIVYSSCCANVCRLCTDGVPGSGSDKSPTLADNDLIRVAMGAAEKAISSIKISTSDQHKGRQISTDSMVENSERNDSETDISTVLNAWFSAGLVTGKYLAEQSNSRRQKS